MSYDVGIWFQPTPISVERAGEIFGALCDATTDGLPTSPGVNAFFDELVAQYPLLETLDDDAVDESPWSVSPEFDSDAGLVLNLVFSKAPQALDWIRGRAHAHGLVFYDPFGPHLRWPDTGPIAVLLELSDGNLIEAADGAAIKGAIKSLGVEDFAILASGEQHYMQTKRESTGWILEYRAGSEADHFEFTDPLTAARVIEMLTKYAQGDTSFMGASWSRLKL